MGSRTRGCALSLEKARTVLRSRWTRNLGLREMCLAEGPPRDRAVERAEVRHRWMEHRRWVGLLDQARVREQSPRARTRAALVTRGNEDMQVMRARRRYAEIIAEYIALMWVDRGAAGLLTTEEARRVLSRLTAEGRCTWDLGLVAPEYLVASWNRLEGRRAVFGVEGARARSGTQTLAARASLARYQYEGAIVARMRLDALCKEYQEGWTVALGDARYCQGCANNAAAQLQIAWDRAHEGLGVIDRLLQEEILAGLED